MAENLNIGDTIHGTSDANDNGTIEKYCYNDDLSNCDTYGGLYQWDEMMQYQPSDSGNLGTTQGICPDGWHVPTNSEWDELAEQISNDNGGYTIDEYNSWWNYVGDHLKATSGWYDFYDDSEANGTDDYGFSGLPGGWYRGEYNDFNRIESWAYWWSATENNTSRTWSWCTIANEHNLSWIDLSKEYGFSVRCVKVDVRTED